MRRKLTVLMAAMITVCGLAGCGGKTPAASAAAPAETTAAAKGADSDWYMEALNDETLAKDYPFHCFVDVNGDGVPVLFMSSTEDSFIGDEDRACMIIYDSGSPKIVKEIGGNGGERKVTDLGGGTSGEFSKQLMNFSPASPASVRSHPATSFGLAVSKNIFRGGRSGLLE